MNILEINRNSNNLSLDDCCVWLELAARQFRKNPETLVKTIQFFVTKLDMSDARIKHLEQATWPASYDSINLYRSLSLRVFIIRIAKGAQIPPHNHPGMSGMAIVLRGKIQVTTFKPPERRPVSFLKRDESYELEAGDVTTLTPGRNNYHQLVALQDSCLLDILTPDYCPWRVPEYYQITIQNEGAFVGVQPIGKYGDQLKLRLKQEVSYIKRGFSFPSFK